MITAKTFILPCFDSIPFSDRPKGDLFRLSVNPYNGSVVLALSNYRESGNYALDALRAVVSACDSLEKCGVDMPLDYLMSHDWDTVASESLQVAAEVKLLPFEGRSERDGCVGAAAGVVHVKKAS